MKSTAMIIVSVTVLLVGGVSAYSIINRNNTQQSVTPATKLSSPAQQLQPETNDSMPSNTTTPINDTSMIESSETAMKPNENRYVPFSPELLLTATDTRRVLFFYANWCPTCKSAEESFSDFISRIPADVTVIRVNYNDTETDQAEKDLAKKYGITYQHTFVQIDANGEEITKWNGGEIDMLLSNIK